MKIVIVDDEKAMHLIMRRMLGKIEEVEVVGSFLETMSAYSFVENHEVDLVLVDISMPRESGIEFAQRLRERGEHMKIVFVTSHKEYALSAFDVYAYDYIVKPLTQDRLLRTIQRALTEQSNEGTQMDRRSVTLAAGPVETKYDFERTNLAQQELRTDLMENWPDWIEGGDLTNKPGYQKLNDANQLMNSPEHMEFHLAKDTGDALQVLVDPLTNRETEILLALAEGLSNKEIADRFLLTEGTVKNHLYNLYSKLSVKRRAQAIKRARELRILR
ncbi:response regulator transcription factor [Paenibacillus sp. WQ 127069]|uniref:Response regulator transcription factor n=1 Tax=Paenibacillus baimaensis TaxID=2982185 RepID=A0ABT2UBJ6_9BACL|nr:response regulator transcription factor [Paenibacillus sp. WQ 127069]MCU6792005.1 response regulator transcription factor [Paenibacillus sp. WQ 127069]